MGEWNAQRSLGWAVLCSSLAVPLFITSLVVLRVAHRQMRWAMRIVISLAFAVSALLGVQNLTLDGIVGVLRLGAEHDTQYAPGYSAIGFMGVRAGMSEQRFVELAGDPLEVYAIPQDPGLVGWRWTRSHGDTNYRLRVVLFGTA